MIVSSHDRRAYEQVTLIEFLDSCVRTEDNRGVKWFKIHLSPCYPSLFLRRNSLWQASHLRSKLFVITESRMRRD
jgi:hypothetical protein